MTDWRVIAGSDGYEVSTDGEVRRGRRILKPYPTRGGYLLVGLNCKDGARRRRLVHHLVLEAFVGPRPEGMECCHGNAKRQDNRLANLRYGTRLENARDRIAHGNQVRGRAIGVGKLCLGKARAIRERSQRGEGPRSLGRAFGVSHSSIQAIIQNRTWKDREVIDLMAGKKVPA